MNPILNSIISGFKSIKKYIFKQKKCIQGDHMPYETQELNLEEKSYTFDITTTNSFIDCKSSNWEELNDQNIIEFKKNSLEKKKIALLLNQKYEIHSKHPIPASIKKWLIENQIKFNQ